jgi:hypothetical protein
MIEMETGWDWSDIVFEGYAVSSAPAAVEREQAVAVMVGATNP